MNILERLSTNKKIAGIVTLVVLVVAIPLTLSLVQRPQDIRQRASEPTVTISPPAASPVVTERRRSISGTLVGKTENSFTLKDAQGNQTTINFLPDYTKIYKFPSAAEYTPSLLPAGVFMTGTVLVLPKERSKSGEEELVGEIFHLPANTH